MSLKVEWTGKAQWVAQCLEKSQCESFGQAQKRNRPKTCELSSFNTHKSHTNLIVNVYSNQTTFKLQRTRFQNTQLVVYISNTPVVLKQSQGYQPYGDNVDHKQGYNHSKFERSCINGVRNKANVKVSLFQTTIWQLSPLNIRENKKKIVAYSWSTWRNQQSCKVSNY